jgi:cell division protein FtsB
MGTQRKTVSDTGGTVFEPAVTKTELAQALVRVTQQRDDLRGELDTASETIASLALELSDLKRRYRLLISTRARHTF